MRVVLVRGAACQPYYVPYVGSLLPYGALIFGRTRLKPCSVPGQTEPVVCGTSALVTFYTSQLDPSTVGTPHRANTNTNTRTLLKIDDHRDGFLTVDRVCVFRFIVLVKNK